MTRFLKQRWVLVALAVAATLLFIKFVYPKIRKMSPATVPQNDQGAPAQQSLQSRLIGSVTAYQN